MVTAIYAALLGVVFFVLSIRIIQRRRRSKVVIGAGDSTQLLRLIRVHGNFAEYVPFSLLLIYFLELQLQTPCIIHILCSLLCLGRILHAYGVEQLHEDFRLRVMGMVLTFTALVGACIGLLLCALF